MLLIVMLGVGCSSVKEGRRSLNDILGFNQNGPSNRTYSDYQHSDSGSGTRGTGYREEDFGMMQNPNRMVLPDLSPSELSTTIQSKFNGQDQAKAETYYNQAQSEYDQAISIWENDPENSEAKKIFAKSSRLFRLAASAWPDSALEQDALFMMGEAQFFAHHYVQANRAYELLVSRYPGTTHMDLVQQRRYTIAIYWLELNRESSWVKFNDVKRPAIDLAGQARRILHNIRLDDPTGKIADDATMALGKAFFEAEKYADSADTFEDLRRTYPGSQHQFEAHMLELKARLLAYEGAEYDGTQLRKADVILKQMVNLFPDQVREQREYLDVEAGNIRNLLAERDFSVAQFYEGRRENRAANFYYQKVAKNFSGTEFANLAETKVAELKDAAPVPEQQANWLVAMFPDPEHNTKPLIPHGNSGTIFR